MSPRRTKINDSKSQGDEENLARARSAGRHTRPITRRALGRRLARATGTLPARCV